MLTGNREILPISCSSRAGNEKKSPSRPLPASNVFSVLNSSFMHIVMSSEVAESRASRYLEISNDDPSTPLGMTEVVISAPPASL